MLKTNIKISLIIPVYNVEKYLRKCLDSAINQTLKDIEIIVVNDGSTDKSLDICKEYEAKENRIILIDQKNSGLGISRNNAISIARGEFVCFLDSDDTLEIKTLQKTYEKAFKESSDIVIFGFERINENTHNVVQIRDDLEFDTENESKEVFFRRVISANFKHMSCAMIIRRDIFVAKNIQFPATLHEDIYVTPKLFYYAKKVSFIKKHYYKWLIRSGSITNTITSKHIDGIITALFYVKCFLLKENILQKYHHEITRFYLVYLDLLFRRIKSYIKDVDHKEKLFNELFLKSYAILSVDDLKCIESKYNLDRFDEFIKLYVSFIEKEQNSNSNKINIALKSELQDIKNSNGYKIMQKYYLFRDTLLPIGSLRRKIVKKIFLRKEIQNTAKKQTSSATKNNIYKVVFMPHKDYHVWTMGLIARELKQKNISSCILDLTDFYRDEGSREEAKKFPDIPFLDFSILKNNQIDFDCLVCMNDWDKRVVRPQIIDAKKRGKKTIGIVEGVQDFFDLDTKQNRETYRYVEYVFLTGKHDELFFKDRLDKTDIVGIPRLKKLLQQMPKFPMKPLAVINMNFSYNVLADKAIYWLKNAIEGCQKAGIDYVITQHPADKTDLSGYPVTKKTMYEIIEEGSIVVSRFGSTIIEALAMGKPCVYHNSHNEKVIKYQEPMGAYSLSFDSCSLAEAIKYELSLNIDYKKRANAFLSYHCNVNNKKSSALLSANKIQDILK